MPTNGNLEPLRDYLAPRVNKLVLIDQPHPGSNTLEPKIIEYHGGNSIEYAPAWWIKLLSLALKLSNQNKFQLLFKVRDFLSVFDVTLRKNSHFDYFIGVEGINTLAGILMKKLGRVTRVIYYVLDFSPNRYGPLLNGLYLALDRYCATHSDFIWDVSQAIHPARIQAGLTAHVSAPIIHVPIGVYPDQIISTPVGKRLPLSIAYMGTLSEEQGPDLAIAMMPKILKSYPTATLHIIGGGQKNLERLQALAASLKLTDKIVFYGFVVRSADMAQILSHCYLAIAPYRSHPKSIRQYGDASKLRSYAAAGLPIVTTPVPPLGRMLQKLGGAIISQDNTDDLAKSVISLFSSPHSHAKIRRVLEKFARDNTWNNEFSKAFNQMTSRR